ncbi:MAG: hypothetical protein ABL899_00720 [Nitrospira sp.]
MKYFNRKILVFVLLISFSVPLVSFGQNGINPGNTPPPTPSKTGTGEISGITYQCVKTVDGQKVYGDCGFNDLVEATNFVVRWGTGFALAFSFIVIAYAGFKYMISGGSTGELQKAKDILVKVAKGIGYILAAWLIVTLILNGLGVQGVNLR